MPRTDIAGSPNNRQHPAQSHTCISTNRRWESLNLDEERSLLDNFYASVITPVFFVECLADLEKEHAKQEHAGATRRLARRPNPGMRVPRHGPSS